MLDYYARLSGVSLETRKQKIDGLLDRVGLGDVGSRQLRKFSKGMLQRVGIAQAIIHDPEVVFLDEPMSGLDPLGRHEVRELIQGLKDEGKTIFFSTHILSDAEALCDRVAVIHKGELRGIGAINEIRTSVAGRSEVIWDGAHALSAVSSSLIESHVTGKQCVGLSAVKMLILCWNNYDESGQGLFPLLRCTAHWKNISSLGRQSRRKSFHDFPPDRHHIEYVS